VVCSLGCLAAWLVLGLVGCSSALPAVLLWLIYCSTHALAFSTPLLLIKACDRSKCVGLGGV
jgi:hypothetical protein